LNCLPRRWRRLRLSCHWLRRRRLPGERLTKRVDPVH
jgi:hypothetical protein